MATLRISLSAYPPKEFNPAASYSSSGANFRTHYRMATIRLPRCRHTVVSDIVGASAAGLNAGFHCTACLCFT